MKADFIHWHANWWYTNIKVQVPSDDFQSTVGLCGNFDGDGSNGNELRTSDGQSFPNLDANGIADKRFTESWRYVRMAEEKNS